MNANSSLELSPTEIGALSDAARGTVVAALVSAVRADGRVDPREVVQLNALLSRWAWTEAGVTDEAVARYFEVADIRVAALQTRADIVRFGRECASVLESPALREKIVRQMIELVYADGAFLPQEQGFLTLFNEGFGLPAERFAALCGRADDRDIFAATASGQVDAVRSLLDRGVSVDERDARQWTPLHVAVATGHLPVVELLLARGADVHARHGQNSTPLFLACHKPREAIAERLLRAGARPGDAGAHGLTPLHVAATFGQTGVARVLVRGGARFDPLNAHGRTPLHDAAAEGQADMVEFLLSAGAPVDARSSRGCTALHFASTRGEVRTVRALLDAGADPDARDHDRQTPLVYAAANHPEALSLLLARGAQPDLASTRGVTPLHVAARQGFSTCVRLLLDAGAAIDPLNVEGGSPLFGAAVHRRSDVYDLLVQRGARPDLRTKFGSTPADSIGAAVRVTLRGLPFTAPAPDSEPAPRSLSAPGSPTATVEQALATVPLSDESTSLVAHFDDYQLAVWTGDQPGPAQVLVAGPDAHGRPAYVAVASLKRHGEARSRLLVLDGARGRRWLPVFTNEAAARAFRERTELVWPEAGTGLADAVMGAAPAAVVFRIAELPLDGVIVNPYGPSGPRVLSLEDCDQIARRLTR